MRFKNIIGLVLTLCSGLAHANLVEDGSQFTGVFRAEESSCFVPATVDLAGQPVAERTDFNFKGSIDNLTDENGSIMTVAPFELVDHGGGIQTGQSGQYLSDHEFIGQVTIINQGQTTQTRDDYKLNQSGLLTHTTLVKTGVGQFQVTRVCHFQRLD